MIYVPKMLSDEEVAHYRKLFQPWEADRIIQWIDGIELRRHDAQIYMHERWPIVFELRNFSRHGLAHWNQDVDDLTELERWIEENLTTYGYHPDDKFLMGIGDPDEAAAFKMVWG